MQNTFSLELSGEECGRDCTSCENQKFLDELHGFTNGNQNQLDDIVDRIMDKSMLTPTKMQLIEEKRKLIKPLTEDDDLEEVMIKIDRDLRISKEKPPA